MMAFHSFTIPLSFRVVPKYFAQESSAILRDNWVNYVARESQRVADNPLVYQTSSNVLFDKR